MKARSYRAGRLIVLTALFLLLLPLCVPVLADDLCVSRIYYDVPPEDNWAHEGIDYCIYEDLMNGVDDYRFEPGGAVTRVQFVTILYRLAGSPEFPYQGRFTDITEDKWFASAVEWAAENRIAPGVTKKLFAPDEVITREQIALMLYRYFGSPETDGDLSLYADAGEVSGDAVDAMIWATENNIINGIESEGQIRLDAHSGASRGQIAAITMRVGKKIRSAIPENGPVIGHLEHEDQVEWYTFDMAEKGAVYFSFEGLQNARDDAEYHWSVDIYDVDRETVMEEFRLCGYSNNRSRVEYVGYPSLDEGTYYIRVTRAKEDKLRTTGFTRDPFRIYRNTVYFSATGIYANKSVPTFSEAGQIVYSSGHTYFVKKNNGDAIAAFFENSLGVEVPVLVSDDKDAVAMIMFTESGVSELEDAVKSQVGGRDYYCTAAGDIKGYAYDDEKKPYYVIRDCGKNSEKAVMKLLNKVKKNERNWKMINAAAAAAIAFLGFFIFRMVTANRPLPKRLLSPHGDSGSDSGQNSVEAPLYSFDRDLPEFEDALSANHMMLDHLYQMLASDYPEKKSASKASADEQTPKRAGRGDSQRGRQ